MPQYKNREDIPPGAIKRNLAFRGTVVVLDKRYGKGNWGEEEVIDHLLHYKTVKERAVEERGRRVVEQKLDVNERLKLFESQYENVTHNDRQMLMQLVQIEGQQEALLVNINSALEEGNLDQHRRLVESQVRLSSEYRQIQATLGIDRASRGEQIDSALELKRYAQGAAELLAKHAIYIKCPHCPAGTKIEMGFVLYHFRETQPYRWWTTCPRCGGDIVIESEGVPLKAVTDTYSSMKPTLERTFR